MTITDLHDRWEKMSDGEKRKAVFEAVFCGGDIEGLEYRDEDGILYFSTCSMKGRFTPYFPVPDYFHSTDEAIKSFVAWASYQERS